MSKRGISNDERSTSKPGVIGKKHRFLGLSLAGGKTDKACLAVLEYYPEYKKIFLTKVLDKIKNEESISADLKLFETIDQNRTDAESLALDVPWQLPLCLRCKLKCPGYERCQEDQILWMWNYYKNKNMKKRPKKIFTPYTQRTVEMFLATELEEPFIVPHAMGANRAPVLARATFLQRRVSLPTIEVFPTLTLWRIGRSLNMIKSHLLYHRHSARGSESRRAILNSLNSANIAFVYEQDIRIMVENNHAFEAFLCSMTGFLKFMNLTEKRPDGFPKAEDWIDFPLKNIKWKSL